jgi:hypothetical protein
MGTLGEMGPAMEGNSGSLAGPILGGAPRFLNTAGVCVCQESNTGKPAAADANACDAEEAAPAYRLK